MLSSQEKEYISRINRVIDHIQSNINKTLALDELAKVACFSPFHFHRVFRAIVGETLNEFIQRLRIEKAASLLLTNPNKSITEIAFDIGFSSSASFARLFKDFYGMSATEMRNGGYQKISKIRKDDSNKCKMNSNNGKDSGKYSGYISCIDVDGGANLNTCYTNNNSGSIKNMSSFKNVKVQVESVPKMTVAYIRHIGPYKGNAALFENLWGKLTKWAGPRGLLNQNDLKVLNIYHDDPEITDENNLRISIAISVPEDTKVEGEIGKMVLEAGDVAMAHFEIDVSEYQKAWDFVCGEWLPNSGYQPDDRPCYELCLNDPAQHPQHKHIIAICVPVKPL